MNISYPSSNRIGIHFLSDLESWKETDLLKWLPELDSLNIHWIILNVPLNRAIPEQFIKGLLKHGIQPILHFKQEIDNFIQPNDLDLLLSVYSRWGIKYVILFDKPNLCASWSDALWIQSDLVERFLDIFLPISELVLKNHMLPVFPPLEPGGDYWDIAFLSNSMKGLKIRASKDLMDNMILSAYVSKNALKLPLNWGNGGPERWPESMPYHTPDNQENQFGINIYEWYSTTVKAILGRILPIIILGVGLQAVKNSTENGKPFQESKMIKNLLAIADMCNGNENCSDISRTQSTHQNQYFPPFVLSCNFYLLDSVAQDNNPCKTTTIDEFFKQPILKAWKKWVKTKREIFAKIKPDARACADSSPINHYLLIPIYDWGVSEWLFEVIRPYIKQNKATVGFSIFEAAHASMVTIVGGKQSFSDEEIEYLKQAGCSIDYLIDDGTSIATIPEIS